MMQPQLEPGNLWLDRRQTSNMFVAGRLKPDVTRGQALADLNRIAQELGRIYPEINEGLRIDLVEPGLVGSFLPPPMIGFTSVIFLITGLVLLIVCTNLASLLLARASDRKREVAVRLALGAGTRHLLLEVLTESPLLSFLGAEAGLVAAQWPVSGPVAMRLPIDVPLTLELSWNARTFLFALAAAAVSTLPFGPGPRVVIRPDPAVARAEKRSGERAVAALAAAGPAGGGAGGAVSGAAGRIGAGDPRLATGNGSSARVPAGGAGVGFARPEQNLAEFANLACPHLVTGRNQEAAR